ncbi:hypothetical protein COO91_05646 [Nostoc flagelliforme CCNUN1]|uniref:Uncharacterized protein n=1 Tax=Nostoc flagelliforme CCNUN1 TaxID=2038116 RepID=A0A2K8SW15_9NOSO|nr:hypothetical protein COO91_05646 [Nostoc flagelliforme CCNUN1]
MRASILSEWLNLGKNFRPLRGDIGEGEVLFVVLLIIIKLRATSPRQDKLRTLILLP